MRVRKKSKTSLAGDAIKLTAGDIRNISVNPDMINNSYMFMKQIRGTSAYWKDQLADLLARIKHLGIPELFLTVSVDDMNWPEMAEIMKHDMGLDYKNLADAVKKNPVIVALYADRRIQALIKYIKESKVFGEVSDYICRAEFQNRGSVHYHMFWWIKDAPSPSKGSSHEEICAYIDKVICTELPDPNDVEFYEKVKSRQVHGHTESCQTKGKYCKFHFPRSPCEKTKILYEYGQNMPKKGNFYETKRSAGCEMLNAYNPKVFRFWPANMDIQFVNGEAGIAYYVMKYAMKAEPAALSQALKDLFEQMDSIGNLNQFGRAMRLGMTVLKTRRMSAQEAAYRIYGLKMVHSSRAVIKISTLPPNKRVGRLKNPYDISQMDDSSEEVFDDSFLEIYRKRPKDLEQMTYLEFASWYKKVRIGSNKVELLDKSACISKRRSFVCVRTSYVNINSEDYYYSLLLQHLPHRIENDLTGNHENYKDAFLEKESQLDPSAISNQNFQTEIIEAAQRLRTIIELQTNMNDDDDDNNENCDETEMDMQTVESIQKDLDSTLRAKDIEDFPVDSETIDGTEEDIFQSILVNDMSKESVANNIKKMSTDQK